jgi:hypothetical protein
MRRVARFAQGWYAFHLSPEALAEHLVSLDELLAGEGRSRNDIKVNVCGFLHPVGLEAVKRYREVGADEVILLGLQVTGSDMERTLDDMATTIVAPAARL